MLSSRSILQVNSTIEYPNDHGALEWFISGTDLVYSQEETDQADPVTEDMGGQAGIKGRCSFNLDRAAQTMKRYK